MAELFEEIGPQGHLSEGPAGQPGPARHVGLFSCLSVLALLTAASAGLSGQAAGPVPKGKEVQKEVLPDEPHELKRVRPIPALIVEQGRLQFRYARELLAAGRLPQALEQLDRFLLIYPGHPWRFFGFSDRARALERLGRTREAVIAHKAAYREAHNRERGTLAYLRAGRLLAELGQEAEARAIFLEIMRVRPASRAARLAEIELRSLRFLDGTQPGPEPERRSQTPAASSDDKGKEGPPAPTGEAPAREPLQKEAPVESPKDPDAGKKTPV